MNKQELINLYRQMFLIRCFEEKVKEEYMKGNIRGMLHLYIGEEASKTGGVGGEILSQIMEGAFDYLDAPIVRMAGKRCSYTL